MGQDQKEEVTSVVFDSTPIYDLGYLYEDEGNGCFVRYYRDRAHHCRQLLQAKLLTGPRLCRDVSREMRDDGFLKWEVHSAKRWLGIVTKCDECRETGKQTWTWELPWRMRLPARWRVELRPNPHLVIQHDIPRAMQ